MIAHLPLLVALAGLILYALTTNTKAGEVGRIAYAFGLLAWLFTVASHAVSVLR